MCDVLTCTPSSSRSSGASRSVMTLHRRPWRLAATRNLTGARSRDTVVPERSLPVSVPSATTPLAVARKLVIFALMESVDDEAALAEAGTANAIVAASAASVMVWGFMGRTRYPSRRPHIAELPGPASSQSRCLIEAGSSYAKRAVLAGDLPFTTFAGDLPAFAGLPGDLRFTAFADDFAPFTPSPGVSGAPGIAALPSPPAVFGV